MVRLRAGGQVNGAQQVLERVMVASIQYHTVLECGDNSVKQVCYTV